MAAKDDTGYAGIWYCAYKYPSNQHKGEDVSEYYMTVHQRGSVLTLQSLPNQINSYMFVKLRLDGELATGTWEETTSPSGEFAGATYSGAVQLLVDKDHDHMHGKWVGVGQEKGKHEIFTGTWTLRRAGTKELAAAKVSD
ncbi:MAG TPA: hypothetical protein VLA92_04750 [Candidatus Saccharimonadales bacterium]|nr:hypothetical protein [Candidatus Saccharimonadales bacterium]